jgi:hypothetical protein
MAQEEKVECPECGYEVGTKENGTKIKAHKVSGEKCDGSDELVADDDVTPEGIDKGQSYEALDSSQDDEQTDDEQNDPVTPPEPERAPQSVPARVFTHMVKARKPCPYLHQSDWHVANGLMAYRLAIKAGHVPTGEAKNTAIQETATHHLVTYSVPVK